MSERRGDASTIEPDSQDVITCSRMFERRGEVLTIEPDSEDLITGVCPIGEERRDIDDRNWFRGPDHRCMSERRGEVFTIGPDAWDLITDVRPRGEERN